VDEDIWFLGESMKWKSLLNVKDAATLSSAEAKRLDGVWVGVTCPSTLSLVATSS